MAKGLKSAEVYKQMRAHCLSKDGAFEDRPWGDVAWKVKKKAFVFAGEGGASFTIKSTPERQEALVLHPHVRVAAYVGRFGWVTVEVVDEETLELAKDLADESYRLVAKTRQAKH